MECLELLYGYVTNFGVNLCMELVRVLYGYLFGGLQYLFLCRILVWNGYLVWLFGLVVVLNGGKICIDKMLGFRGDAVFF